MTRKKRLELGSSPTTMMQIVDRIDVAKKKTNR